MSAPEGQQNILSLKHAKEGSTSNQSTSGKRATSALRATSSPTTPCESTFGPRMGVPRTSPHPARMPRAPSAPPAAPDTSRRTPPKTFGV